jgi:hypothetical protein
MIRLTAIMLAAFVVALALLTAGPGRADEASLSVAPWTSSPDGSVAIPQAQLKLVGDSSSKEFGVSVRAVVTSAKTVTGSAKLMGYLYRACDAKPPGQTDALPVASIELADIKALSAEQSIVAVKEAKTFVTMQEIKCAKVTIECTECQHYEESSVAAISEPDSSGALVSDAQLVLLGDKSSKKFGISFRGKVTAPAELIGDSIIQANFYRDCSNGGPAVSRIPVGTAVLLESKTLARERIVTAVIKEAEALAPVKDIKCSRIAVICPSCKTVAPITSELPLVASHSLVGGAVRVENPIVQLTGWAGESKFAWSFQGTVTKDQDVSEKEEVLMLYLYADCKTNATPIEAGRRFAGALELITLTKDSPASADITITKDSTEAFLPLNAIKCGKFGISQKK